MALKLSTVYKIDGEPIYEPSSAPVSIEPIHGEASGRTEDGTMHTELIGNKRKIELKYNVMTQAEISTLLQKVMKQYYTFTYQDPAEGINTIECYGTSINQEFYGFFYNGLWRNVSFSCIER